MARSVGAVRPSVPFMAAMVALLAVAATAQQGLPIGPGDNNLAACSCIALYDPVCGEDGATYGNSCEAGCRNVGVKCEGECPCGTPGGVPTPDPVDPCANCDQCLAIDYLDRPGEIVCQKCDPGYTLKDGRCMENDLCACIALYAPVCGVDGMTYSNSGCAACANVKTECEGECPCSKPCACTKEYNPQCGTDGTTYGNPCQARCTSAEIECQGECPCSKTKPGSCPPVRRYSVGVCVDFCSKDDDCPGKRKCCSNGCGHTCRVPVPETDPEGCPPDQPIVNCLVDPCTVEKCDAFPWAKCVSDFCGGCNAKFFIGRHEVTKRCDRKRLRGLKFSD